MSSGNPKVSIVIPCRNHAEELVACLQSLSQCETALSAEVIVVDAGLDPEVAVVAERVPGVRVVRGTAPLLPGAARNLGVDRAAGDWVCFIDADCVVEPGWLAAAIGALRSGAKVVGGPILHGEPWNPIATIDNLMQFVDSPEGRPAGPMNLLPSCNVGISRADFLALGGFPELDQACGEDVLFSQKANARWTGALVFVPAMRIRHFGRRTLRRLWAHQESFGYARGRHGLLLSATYRRLGRSVVLAPVVALRRMTYLATRVTKWQPASLIVLVLGLPILVVGMTAWCRGFYRGIASSKQPSGEAEGPT
jgi:glycosyltransferase involved in cell wall biosynthesis